MIHLETPRASVAPPRALRRIAGFLLLGLSGCVLPKPLDPFASELAQGHVVIHIGHVGSGSEEEVTWQDGTTERVWSDKPDESAARAVFLYVRCADQAPASPDDFVEVSRAPEDREAGGKAVLELSPAKEAHGRAVRVFLSLRNGRWIADSLVICPSPPKEEEDEKKDF